MNVQTSQLILLLLVYQSKNSEIKRNRAQEVILDQLYGL